MSTPVHEFLEEFHGITKEAMTPATKAAITMGGISAGTTMLAAVGASQLQSGIQSAHDAVARSIAYKKMVRDNPDVQKMDGKQTRRYFNTLYNTSPELAKDPFVAGSWVKKVEEYDYVDPQSIKTLAETGSTIRRRQMDTVIPAFQLAQGATQAGIGEYGRQEDLAQKRSKQRYDLAGRVIGEGMKGALNIASRRPRGGGNP